MLQRIGRACKAILNDESGQTMLEYIAIVVLVIIAAIGAWKIVSSLINRGAASAQASILP